MFDASSGFGSVAGSVKIPMLAIRFSGAKVEGIYASDVQVSSGTIRNIQNATTAIYFHECGFAIGQARDDAPPVLHGLQELLDASLILDNRGSELVGSCGVNVEGLKDIHHGHHWMVVNEILRIGQHLFPVVVWDPPLLWKVVLWCIVIVVWNGVS